MCLFKWTVDFHNFVNVRLNKPQISCELAYQYYNDESYETCASDCGEKPSVASSSPSAPPAPPVPKPVATTVATTVAKPAIVPMTSTRLTPMPPQRTAIKFTPEFYSKGF